MSDAIIAPNATLPTADLGRGGPIVSRLALGAMTFGVETDESDAHRQLDTFVDAGGTLIDTADVYADGESERIIGRWAAARGGVGDLLVATKGRFAPPPGSHGASRRSALTAVSAIDLPPYPYGMVQDFCDVGIWRRLGSSVASGG